MTRQYEDGVETVAVITTDGLFWAVETIIQGVGSFGYNFGLN